MGIRNKIWYEKYRPKKIKHMILPESYIKIFNDYIQDGEIPHIILHGPPGSGKTTVAQILIDKCSGRNLKLSASSEDRGVETIKKRVTQFASASKLNNKKNICFFDEAEGITKEAQEALKTPIEKFHKNCRFIFTTNEIGRINDAIVSRCQIFRLESFPIKKLNKKIFFILDQEKIKHKEKDVKEVIAQYYPDIRSVINIVQLNSSTGKFKKSNDIIDNKIMAHYIKKGKLYAIRNMINGISDFTFLYRFLFNQFIPKEIKKDKDKSNAAITVADYLYRNANITDREINFAACVVELMEYFKIEKINFTEPF